MLSLRLRRIFSRRKWKVWKFQAQAIEAFQNGESGLVSVPTGMGKTFAAVLGPIEKILEEKTSTEEKSGLRILYISPLKAVSRDIEKAILEIRDELGGEFQIGSRTGDTSSYQRAKQKIKLPEFLITTPESLSLLLCDKEAKNNFSQLTSVIVDEWHELLGTKRGTQTELLLARLRQWNPEIRVWGLTATLGNLAQAAEVLCPQNKSVRIITGEMDKAIVVESLIPKAIDNFPWAGHLGLSMLPQVLERIHPERSTLFFTNTRSFAERWYRAVTDAKPEWKMALHHGSLDRKERERVEQGLKDGSIKLVVTTSSLELGVDFPQVEEVFQIGSPKGVGRIIQRAGRASHQPGCPSRIIFIPTHVWELVEISALRDAVHLGKVESRFPLRAPLDVLSQHLITCAMGGGFVAEEMFAEVRMAYSYRDLAREDFDWILGMVSDGGQVLHSYPQYRKLFLEDGRWRPRDARVGQLHKLNIGTITSDSSVQVKFMRGQTIGQVEEGFMAKLRRGDRFHFAGRTLVFVMMKDLQAFVRLAPDSKNAVATKWMGSRIPLSSELSQALREEIGQAARGKLGSAEMKALKDLFRMQSEISKIPTADRVLAETFESRDGYHLFLYPFEGRQVHEGLASLLAFRFSQIVPNSFSVAMNDYGLEILSARPFDFQMALQDHNLFSILTLRDDILRAVNMAELARRQFREIARIAGLTFSNYGAKFKSSRQVQASSGLIYDVLRENEPSNLYLRQAEGEVKDRQFEESRLAQTLLRLEKTSLEFVAIKRPSPLSFPLIVDRLGARLSSETIGERVERLKARWARSGAKAS